MRPVQIALQLIEALSANQPAGATELSQLTGLPRSTTQRALVALNKAGWIEVADERRGNWTLSLRALAAAGRATETHGALRDVAIPIMEELRRGTGESVHLMVRQGSRVVLTERLDGILDLDQFRPFGSDAPMATSAAGQAILAALPAEETASLLPAGDLKALKRTLAAIRSAGYAVVLGDDGSNVGAVAAAIQGRDGRAFAAVGVVGPLSRMTAQRAAELGPTVMDAAGRIGAETILAPGGEG